jgi:hypothetical protein
MLLALSALMATTSKVRAGDGRASGTGPWVDAIRLMDEALAKGDLRAALRAREDARLAALGSQGWEGLVLVGDATLRVAHNSGLGAAMEPAARRAYVFALHRARRQGSLEGVLRVTEALVALGDRDMARKACGIAGTLAASSREPEARERVRALEDRLRELTTSVPAASAAPVPGVSLTRSDDWRGFDGGE